jgi:hypothetical protein
MSTISYKSFNVDNLKFSTPEENKTKPDITKYQLMSLPRYLKDGKEVLPQIQGPWMTLSTYGIPGKLDKNGKPILNTAGAPLSDRERGKLKIPFNLDDPDSKKFYDLLCAIDQKCEDDKEVIWGTKKKADAYKYQALVRQPAENPDAPEDAPAKPDYVTVKFDFDYKTSGINTKVYQNTDGDRVELSTPTLDDVQKYVRYKSEFRPVFALCKLYAGKAAGDDGKRKYGLGLKLKHIEVKPSEMSAQDEQEAFVDDDADDDAPVQRKLVKETKEAPKKVESVSESDEEEKPAPKVATKASKKVESESEEEDKLAPKVATKASKKVESESEEEEDKPAPKARRGRGARTTNV